MLKDKWTSGGAYESYVGRWSRHIAREFIEWLDMPKGARWLDVGCGTGALTETILKLADPSEVRGIDLSEGFIEYAREHIRDQRVSFAVGSADALPAESGHYGAVVSGLMLNFVPDAAKAIHEMKRAASIDGVIGVYVWDYAEGMEFMRYFWDAAAADPLGRELDEGTRFPICKPEALAGSFRAAGLGQVETRAIDIPTHFRDFDDYWQPFLGGTGAAPTYAMSLSEEKRGELRERIRGALPIQGDGSIEMIARAWAVKGINDEHMFIG
jgi:SAM-dependent methyltransferase